MMLIKTFNSSRGQRNYYVNPDSLIKSLRTEEGEDVLFLFKGMPLIDTMTFKFYDMNDGDVICTIRPKICSFLETENARFEQLRDIEKERLRLTDLAYSKLDYSPEYFRKQAEFKIKVLESDYLTPKFMRPQPLFTPIPATQPSNTALPMVWSA